MAVKLNINGKDVTLQSSPDTPLLWALRDELNLTGTKYGCGVAQCGAVDMHGAGAALSHAATIFGASQVQFISQGP